MAKKKSSAKKSKSMGKKNASALIGYENELWQIADALRGSMDAAEYKLVVLVLLFFRYISDAFFYEQHAPRVVQRKIISIIYAPIHPMRLY